MSDSTTIICHIGLSKCGSTVLQNAWAESTNYSTYMLTELVQTIRGAIIAAEGNVDTLKQTISRSKLSRQALSDAPSRYTVISSEGITGGFFQEARPIKNIEKHARECIAVALQSCVDRVLLVVRNPLTWLISSYYQQIKQGSAYTFAEFFSMHYEAILSNLDLENIIQTFSQLDAELTVMPLEMMKENEALFWREYERRLEIPKPDINSLATDVLSANITQKETIALHRELNSILLRLETVISSRDFIDKNLILDAMIKTRKWGTRRALSLADDEQLRTLSNHLAPTSPKSSLIAVKLEDDFKRFLHQRFICPLKDSEVFPYDDILKKYSNSIDGGFVEVR
jgi:hypothetical protein